MGEGGGGVVGLDGRDLGPCEDVVVGGFHGMMWHVCQPRQVITTHSTCDPPHEQLLMGLEGRCVCHSVLLSFSCFSRGWVAAGFLSDLSPSPRLRGWWRRASGGIRRSGLEAPSDLPGAIDRRAMARGDHGRSARPCSTSSAGIRRRAVRFSTFAPGLT